MKTEECEQLVEKLRRSLDDRIEDTSRIHYYDARKMLKGDNKDEESMLIRKAISKYAVLLGRYEYPVIICDSSFLNNGKEGFIVTPDHIFYKGVIKSGTLDIMDIENISLDSGKTGKAIFASNGLKRKQKLPCQLKGKDQERMADVLNDFVEYLKQNLNQEVLNIWHRKNIPQYAVTDVVMYLRQVISALNVEAAINSCFI